MNLHKIF